MQRTNSQITTKCNISAVILVLILLIGGSAAMAQGVLAEKINEQQSRVEVRLYGVPSFPAVQLFDYLLHTMESLDEVRQTGLRVEPEAPAACHASWNVKIADDDMSTFLEEIMEALKLLGKEAGGVKKDKISFTYGANDVELLTRIIPFQSAPQYVAFGSKEKVIGRTSSAVTSSGFTYCPWYREPGAGFE